MKLSHLVKRRLSHHYYSATTASYCCIPSCWTPPCASKIRLCGLLEQTRQFRQPMSTGFTNCASLAEADGSKDVGDAVWRQRLTEAQYHILREKGTDPRGIGLDDCFDDGTYSCAACDTPLYTSAMKFACGCGWPGFWDCIPKAVRELPDADGRRTEILCNACGSHLGHVFRGEGFSNPPPNERHCVNSTSVRFAPSPR